jgi:hypothetical protein
LTRSISWRNSRSTFQTRENISSDISADIRIAVEECVKEASTGEVKIDRRLVDEAGSAAKAKSSGTALSWATLVKRVFEVDPLQCPQCGSRMKVVSFIKRCQRDVVEKILRHCGWREGPLRMLATAGLYPTQRTWIETHELQLVLNPEFL